MRSFVVRLHDPLPRPWRLHWTSLRNIFPHSPQPVCSRERLSLSLCLLLTRTFPASTFSLLCKCSCVNHACAEASHRLWPKLTPLDLPQMPVFVLFVKALRAEVRARFHSNALCLHASHYQNAQRHTHTHMLTSPHTHMHTQGRFRELAVLLLRSLVEKDVRTSLACLLVCLRERSVSEAPQECTALDLFLAVHNVDGLHRGVKVHNGCGMCCTHFALCQSFISCFQAHPHTHTHSHTHSHTHMHGRLCCATLQWL